MKHPESSDEVATASDCDQTSEPSARRLQLEVEEAEAEVAAAEAASEAARARVKAARLRRQADARAAVPSPAVDTPRSVDARTVPPTNASDAAEVVDGGPSAGSTSNDLDPDDISHAGRRSSGRRGFAARRPGRREVAVVAVVAIAGAFALTGYTVWRHHDVADKDRQTAEFLAAARQGVVALTSLDFNNADRDVQRVLDNSTGTFRQDFQNRAQDFTTVVRQSQVSTQGTVNEAAVESMTGDSAVVLVAASSQVTNSAGAQQEPRTWRLSVTVARDGDRIKMSKVEFVA